MSGIQHTRFDDLTLVVAAERPLQPLHLVLSAPIAAGVRVFEGI